MSAPRYSAEFKEQVVLEIVQRSRPVAEVAEIRLVPQTVGSWNAKWRKRSTGTRDGELIETRERRGRRLKGGAPAKQINRAPRKKRQPSSQESRWRHKYGFIPQAKKTTRRPCAGGESIQIRLWPS